MRVGVDANAAEIMPEARLECTSNGGGQGLSAAPHRLDGCLGCGGCRRECFSGDGFRLNQFARRFGFEFVFAFGAETLDSGDTGSLP